MIIGLKSAFYAGLASFIACGLILLSSRWHGRFTFDSQHGVQKFHVTPTPRIGGLGLMLGMLVGWLVQEENPTLVDADHLLGWTLLAAIPALLAGTVEDLTKCVSVRNRLLATMLSGLLGYWVTGYGITHLDFWGLDLLLRWAPFCVLFTAFAVAGVANAYNIIDGFNGLTAAAMIVAVAAMGAIAYEVNDVALAYFALIYIAAILGFMVWNYPFGRLFLGDGGAYAMGFVIAWMAVMLPARNEEVSPWASLLACGYPVMETLYSMGRRAKRKISSGQADSEHLHSLIKKVVIRPRLKRFSVLVRNSMVMLTLLPFLIMNGLFTVWFYDQTSLLMFGFAGSFVLYALLHRRLVRSAN